MAVIGNLPRPLGRGLKKISETQAAITGTGAVTTGLAPGIAGVDAGGAVACSANAATTIPTTFAAISSVSGGTVNIVAVAFAAGANAISAVATNVNVIAIGS